MSTTTTQADAHSPPPSASVSTFSKSQSHSVRSSRAPPSHIRTVVTSPPWARDEPPSPYDQETNAVLSKEHLSEQPRPSDVTSFQSSQPDDQTAGPSRWWAFTRHRPQDSSESPFATLAARQGRGLSPRDRSLSISWLTSPIHRHSQDEHPPSSVARGKEPEVPQTADPRMIQDAGFHIDLPHPDPLMTIANNKTPGWDSPWTPRPPGDIVARITGNGSATGNGNAYHDIDNHEDENEKANRWSRRRKRIRVFLLTNVYVPLLFRFVNITFTTAALAIAIRIRAQERAHNIMGVLGSSPTLVIIFAPLTLVHVMIAVYLEYFGRPLGLWRTSAKLAHTLVEVVFICAWSAALALCFDNFFTSRIPCASPSSTSWYNNLPPVPSNIPNLEDQVGDNLCDEQLALICLVGVGLIMYCYNLVISLYRIFEKVKYHHPVSVI